MYDYKGIVIQNNWKGTKEGIAVHLTCCVNNIPVRFGHNINPSSENVCFYKTIDDNEIFVGDVYSSPRYIRKSQYRYEQEEFKPNYYPATLSKYINRKICIKRTLPKERTFIKPLNYKHFTGFIYDPSSDFKLNKPFKILCSEIVNFVEEWRYYITDGIVVYSSWYKGQSEECEVLPDAPEIEIPEGFYGTIDMGITDKGKLELVECHHPFACGWYGRLNPKDMEIYTQWLIDGRKHLDDLKGYNDSI